MRIRRLGLLVLTIGLTLVVALLPGLVGALVPIAGTIAPSAPLELRGAVSFGGEDTQTSLAAWTPHAPLAPVELALGEYTLTVTEVRWISAPGRPAVVVAPPGSGPTSGLQITSEAHRLRDPTVRLQGFDADARWMVVGTGQGGPRVQVNAERPCELSSALASPVQVLPEGRAPFATTIWSPEDADILSVHCEVAHVGLGGDVAWTLYGTRVRFASRDADGKELEGFEVRTGLQTLPRPSRLGEAEQVFRQATLSAHLDSSASRLPGGRDVWFQAPLVRIQGAVHVPRSDGRITWGSHELSDPHLASDPEGEFALQGRAGGHVVIRGHAWKDFQAVAVGVGVALTGAALLRYLTPTLLGLFTRLTQAHAAEHPRRRAILQAVAAHPGITPKDVARLLGIRRQIIDYHTVVLSRQGLLVRRRFPKTIGLFEPGAASPGDQSRLHRTRSASVRRILGLLEAQDGLTQAALADKMGLSQPRVSKILSELTSLGLVQALPGRSPRAYRAAAGSRGASD